MRLTGVHSDVFHLKMASVAATKLCCQLRAINHALGRFFGLINCRPSVSSEHPPAHPMSVAIYRKKVTHKMATADNSQNRLFAPQRPNRNKLSVIFTSIKFHLLPTHSRTRNDYHEKTDSHRVGFIHFNGTAPTRNRVSLSPRGKRQCRKF